MSVTNSRRRGRDSSPDPTENIPSPTRKRPSSPDNENEDARNDDSGEKRCKCHTCSEKGQPVDFDRNWSIRFFAKTMLGRHGKTHRVEYPALLSKRAEAMIVDRCDRCHFPTRQAIDRAMCSGRPRNKLRDRLSACHRSRFQGDAARTLLGEPLRARPRALLRRAIFPRTNQHGGMTGEIEARPSHPSTTNPAENIPLLGFTPTRADIPRSRDARKVLPGGG